MSVVYMFCVLMFSTSSVHTLTMDEPTCLSKFDYEYKLLSKLIELEREQAALKMMLKEQEQTTRELNLQRKQYGSSYTVWGKKDCPGNESSLVYSGYMAGSHYTDGGTGSIFLCLTSDPIWDYYDETIESGGKIYGTEYEFYHHRSTGASKFLGQNVYNKNAPCAVCHITRGTSIMIPGRNECFGGWTKEYSGYLVSDRHMHKQASEYVCLSHKVDVLDANEGNDDERVLYFVEGVCGKGLPCPPYVNGRELTCVVCSL